MAANLARNLSSALCGWPIMSITIWMDSLVALFWINNPGKPWKVFVSNRVKKIAEITEKLKIVWKYCSTKMNLADLGSRGMSIEKMESLEWFTGPKWLLDERDWPPQPDLKTSKDTHSEYKATELVLFNNEREADECDDLLNRGSYWRTLRVTAWILRFVSNCRTKGKKKRKIGPLNTDEILNVRTRWVKRVQDGGQTVIKSPGWKLEKDPQTEILTWKGRVKNYQTIYLGGGIFVSKLVQHVHNQIMHLGVSNTMAAVRETWWIPKLREKAKKAIHKCNVCRLYSTKPFEAQVTAEMPSFRTERSRPLEVTGLDFAGPLYYRVSKNQKIKTTIDHII